MRDLDELIDEATDGREVKRAVSVKMGQQGFSPAQICQVLNGSPQYVSKWKGHYEAEGAAALRLSHRGSEGYLSEAQRQEIPVDRGAPDADGRSGAGLCGRTVWGGLSVQTIVLRFAGGRGHE